jgi:hypothetical protein
MKPSSVLLLALILSAIIPGAMAGTVDISFSDLDPMSDAEFWLYGYNETSGEMSLLQRVTLNDSLTLSDNSSYIMVYRPTEISWFNDPLNSIEILFLTIPKVFLLGLFGAVFFCVVYLFYRVSTGGGRR